MQPTALRPLVGKWCLSQEESNQVHTEDRVSKSSAQIAMKPPERTNDACRREFGSTLKCDIESCIGNTILPVLFVNVSK